MLRNLAEESRSRTASIEGQTDSVFSQVRRIGLHEQEHLAQIETVPGVAQQENPPLTYVNVERFREEGEHTGSPLRKDLPGGGQVVR